MSLVDSYLPDLNRYTKVVLLVTVGFFILRTWLATQSGFGFHQGWNEGHYALIARGFLERPLYPGYGDKFVYNVTPLFPYLVGAAFGLFGESVLAARLVSILAATLTIPITYALGRTVYGRDRPALLGAGLIALIPYFQLYGGRAQTDMTMLFFFTASLLCIVRGYERDTRWLGWLVAGGTFFVAAFASKQPAIILPAVVLAWMVGNRRFNEETFRRTSVLIAASSLALVPLLGWFYLNYLNAPEPFVTTWRHELFSRTAPFANVKLLLFVGFPLGLSAPLAGVGGEWLHSTWDRVRYGWEWGRDAGPSVLTWWLILYGAFVLYRAPQGHLYYAMALAPPVALLGGRGLDRVLAAGNHDSVVRFSIVALVFLGSIGGTVVLYELAGEFSIQNGSGSYVTEDAGGYLAAEAPGNAAILAPIQYCPPIQWYVRDEVPVENVQCYFVSELTEERLQSLEREAGPVYVVYPRPSWAEQPAGLSDPVYVATEYEYTLMDVIGQFAQRDDKFAAYLNDRTVAIYRVR